MISVAEGQPYQKPIKLLYESSFSRVRTAEGLTDFIKNLVGVLQGDKHEATFLFIIVLEVSRVVTFMTASSRAGCFAAARPQ